MADFNLSPNMSLPIPTVGVDAGPDYANNLNASLTLLDQHDHSPGRGVTVPSSGININADLPFNGSNATTLRAARFLSQTMPITATPPDLLEIYVSGVDLYYNDGNGNQVRLTQSGGVAGSPGSISNLVPPASASYNAGSQTFVWESNALTAANMDMGSITLRDLTASSNGITISAPGALAADYTLTLMSALPVATSFVQVASTGNVTANITPDNSTIEVNSNQLRVVPGSISTTQIANNTSLPGTAVQEQGKNIVVSSTNATTSLAMIRGAVAANGTINVGEGFTVNHSGTGVYVITFTNAFASNPVVVACLRGTAASGDFVQLASFSTTACQINVIDNSVSPIDEPFTFIAIGPR